MESYNLVEIERYINEAFDCYQNEQKLLNKEKLKSYIDFVFEKLDQGNLRVCEKLNNEWICNQWIKKTILLGFRVFDSFIDPKNDYPSYDKIPLKNKNWTEGEFKNAGFRMLPGAIIRKSAFVAKNVVLMPSFINVGAYVGEGTMIDTWVTIGSCATIGKNCHISGGVGIGGVLEPLQAQPVIIEDNCFIGARSEIAEGVIVEEGAVISMGVFISASTKIVDRASNKIVIGRVPAYSVVVPGVLPNEGAGPLLSCAVIVKQVDQKTRSKTSINDILRNF
jgi:2,3,4,5-tetrahydropyridine-2-carboxylate N-succinyltransferase